MSSHSMIRARGLRARNAQTGLSLIFALLALAALSLAAVGLVRSVSGSAVVVGNLGFKMDATATSDRGTEAAMLWLTSNVGGATLDSNDASSGYYATSLAALDPTGRHPGPAARALVDWDDNDCSGMGSHSACVTPSPAVTVNGNTYRYVITRMCQITGSKEAAANSCAVTLANSGEEDPNTSSLGYGKEHGMGLAGTQPYYRVVVRTVGGRDAISFTEAFVHF